MDAKKWLGTGLVILSLVGCGGGGGDSDSGSTTPPAPVTYQITGVIQGIKSGDTIRLNNGKDYGSGEFLYRSSVEDGYSFNIEFEKPENYTCQSEKTSGMINTNNWTNAIINCHYWLPNEAMLVTDEFSSTLGAFSLNRHGEGFYVGRGAAIKYDSVLGWQDYTLLATEDMWDPYRQKSFIDSKGNLLSIWARNKILYSAIYIKGEGWKPRIEIPQVDSIEAIDMAMNSSGQALAAWRTGTNIRVMNFSFEQGWSAPELANQEPIQDSDYIDKLHFKTVLDASGNGMVVWENTYLTESYSRFSNLYYKRFINDAGWERAHNMVSSDVNWNHQKDNLANFDVVMNENGDALMSWVSKVKYMKPYIVTREYTHAQGWATSNVEEKALISEDTAGGTAITSMKIAIDESSMYITWTDDGTCCFNDKILFAKKNIGGNWLETAQVLFEADELSTIIIKDIETDGAGKVFLGFLEETDQGRINNVRAAIYSSKLGWSKSINLADDFTGNTSSIKIEIEDLGIAHFTYLASSKIWSKRVKYEPEENLSSSVPEVPSINIAGSWTYSGYYDACQSTPAQGTMLFSEFDITASGEDWHHDCAISNAGETRLTHSLNNLSSVTPEGFKLVLALFYSSSRFEFQNTKYSQNQISWRIVDSIDNSIEIFELNR